MTASLQVKNDRYQVVLTFKQNGKYKHKWVSTKLPAKKGNKRKAEQFMKNLLAKEEAELEQGQIEKTPAQASNMLFSDAIRHWLEEVRYRVDEVTFQGYESHAKGHILPYFDELGIKLEDVTRVVLQAYINAKSACGRKDGRGGLAPASLRQHKNVLYQTLKLAQRDGLIQSNPCEQVVLPQAKRFVGKFYTAEQMKHLLEVTKDERLYPLIYITSIYGLRRSEVLGLKWDSVNYETQTLSICHTVAKVTKVVEKDKTKNASSFRSFPLTADAAEMFRHLKKQEDLNRKLFGKEYHNNDYIFKWEDGKPYSPDYVSHAFGKLLKKYNLPHIRFHELRHSCASLLLSQGFGLKDVQEWLGHSDIKMTANIYGHLDTKRKQGIAANMSNLLPAG